MLEVISLRPFEWPRKEIAYLHVRQPVLDLVCALRIISIFLLSRVYSGIDTSRQISCSLGVYGVIYG